ncbi:hypothetical protein [Thioflexithrix psekupsensis]|uniref:Uncharacterized protein n=1 Tax=Thioflexithrix psekupsensis TaxID=1570016 RepID=A0A251X9T2_9GAMM|nr:hypothetical protein [Thioflexithrix psekupsensis]OUD14433.1 hypothetical protein TPSD3_08995 [Thioflexithrix psekupsensis]
MIIRNRLAYVVMGMGLFAATAPLVADDAPLRVRAGDEIQLQKTSPTVKSFTIKLEGSEREREVLFSIERMVRDLFARSRIGTRAVHVSSGTPVMPGEKIYENLEIVINARIADQPNDPYAINITLREFGQAEGEPQRFSYLPEQAVAFEQLLSDYLSKELNLLPRSAPMIAPTTPAPTITPETVAPATPRTTDSTMVIPPPPPPTPSWVNPAHLEAPERVNPAHEVQLQKTSPTVKRFSIKLVGSERENTALVEIEQMIRRIFNESRIGTVAVAVTGEPIAQQSKVYENLEITVNARIADVADEPYRVNITLNEAGNSSGAPQPFSYAQAFPNVFYDELKAYLSKELNLYPRR